jgi:hypothetical protein
MLDETEHAALTRWYSQDHLLEKARDFADAGALEDLEEFVHKTALWPLGRHDSLPAFMLDDEGKPVFPTNLDPRADEDKWQDAIEVGWEVMAAKLGVSHDDVHRDVARYQEGEWELFMKSVEERKKKKAQDKA